MEMILTFEHRWHLYADRLSLVWDHADNKSLNSQDVYDETLGHMPFQSTPECLDHCGLEDLDRSLMLIRIRI